MLLRLSTTSARKTILFIRKRRRNSEAYPFIEKKNEKRRNKIMNFIQQTIDRILFSNINGTRALYNHRQIFAAARAVALPSSTTL